MLTKPLPGVMDDPFHPLSQGCVCHLLFNEGAGDLAYDVSGHGNHGALKNMLPNVQGSKWQGSKFGGGIACDGDDDYIDCESPASLVFTNSDPYSFEHWIKWTEGGESYVIYAGPETTGLELFLIRYGNNNRFGFRDSGGVWTTFAADSSDDCLNVWAHIVWVADGLGNLAVYKNGGYFGSITPTNGTSTHFETFGRAWPNNINYIFKGHFDQIRIYNHTLSAKGIKQLYHDPFCNLMQVPAWRLYSPAVGGLSIPVAMHQYEMLRA